jgi:hypothetical protein
MMLHQIQVVFDAAEDRLLVRISTTDNQEFRAWMTRRFVKLIWPHLIRSIESKVALKAPMPDARQAVMGFEHEKAVKETDFSKPFENKQERAMPLGPAPFLVTQGNIGRDANNNHKISLNPAQGQGMEMAFDDRLMHSFCKLVQQAVAQAQWDIELVVPDGNAPPADEPALPGQPAKKRLLN